MLRKTPVALALGFAWGCMPATLLAQTPPPASPSPAAETTPLKEITVTSTRTPRKTDDVPNTVTVETAPMLEESGARDIKDVFRDELDVSVPSGPNRYTAAGEPAGRAGNEGINIRGLQGNQVLMLVDGIRLANAFSFGAFATGRGDFIDISGAKAIEVLRGPASTQYGSDGLAGALSVRTLDPADLLQKDQRFGGAARFGYSQVDKSWASTLAAAARSGAWQGLVLGTLRTGHEPANRGSDEAPDITRTAPNPANTRGRYLLGKLRFDVSRAHQLGLAVESQEHKQDTEVLSARAVAPFSASSVLDLVANDKVTRDRVSFEHRYADLNARWVQRATTQVYSQDSKVSQRSFEDRYSAADRIRDNTYRQKLLGLSTQLESNFSTGALAQRLSYGLDWSRSKLSGVRDGRVPPAGETFPTKPFPDTDYTLFGAFVQDEIEAGRLSLIPALRFDKYKLDPASDGYTGGAVAALADQALTPRLGVVWRLAPGFAPYAHYAKGFRAPTPDQVNNGFANPAYGYRTIGNPNLKPERAASFEIGVRGRPAPGLRYALAAYDNRYADFISQRVVGGNGTPADPTIFQYINLANAHIHGAEARTDWQFAPRWDVNGGLAWSRGDSETAGVKAPLDTVQPWRAVVGLRYDAPTWSARASVLHSQGKQADRIAAARQTPFAPPAIPCSTSARAGNRAAI